MKLPLYVSSESKNNACRVDKARENECWMRSKSIECHHPTKPCNCQVLGIRSRFAAAEMSQPSHSTPRISAGSERLRQSRGRTERQALVSLLTEAQGHPPLWRSPPARGQAVRSGISPLAGGAGGISPAMQHRDAAGSAPQPLNPRGRGNGSTEVPPASHPDPPPGPSRGASEGARRAATPPPGGRGTPAGGAAAPPQQGRRKPGCRGKHRNGRSEAEVRLPVPARPPAAGCGRVRSARNRPGSDP